MKLEATPEIRELLHMQLSFLTNLKHAQLDGWYPGKVFNLPPECLLVVKTFCGAVLWEERRRRVQQHLSMLKILVWGLPDWLSGIQHCFQLQFLMILTPTIMSSNTGDIICMTP
jgi:hypothetical protein